MDVIDFINILFKNHPGDDSDYDFFIYLIKQLMRMPKTAKNKPMKRTASTIRLMSGMFNKLQSFGVSGGKKIIN